MLSWRRDKKDEPDGTAAHVSPGASLSAPAAGPVPARPQSAIPGVTRLGELLVQEGVISQPQLSEALEKQQETGSFIGQTLVELGYLSQPSLVSFLVKQCKIPHISLLDYNVAEDLFNLVPKEMCERFRLLPIDKLGRILTLAMVDPLDSAALETVRKLCPDLKIKPILCTWNHFEQVAKKVFVDPKQPAAEASIGSFGLAPKKSAVAEMTGVPTAEQLQASKAVAQLVQEVSPSKTTPPQRVSTDVPMPPVVAAPSAAARPVAAPPAKASTDAPVAPRVQAPEALIDRMGDRVREAMTESMVPFIAEQQKLVAMQLESGKGNPVDLAREITEGIRSSLLDSLGPLLDAQARHFAQAAHPQLDTAALTKQLGECMRAAMLESTRAQQGPTEEALASNVSQFPGLRAVDLAQGDAAPPPVDPLEEIGLGIEADDRVRDAILSGRLQRAFTFDAFLSGAANTFTLSVARAVTQKFSREFTPFYLYGDVGVGKTHVLHAIGNAITARNPDLRVAYMTGLRFVSACERAARDQVLDEFRDSFAHWDVLLFDEAQSVAAHKQAQDEMRAVLGALTAEGRLVVVSADRAPDQLHETSHQLVSRLAAGIVSRLHAADMPTRVAILQRHARVLKAKVADDILSLIAARVPVDVRKMTGALRKALAYAQISGSEMTHELTEEILSHLTATEAA